MKLIGIGTNTEQPHSVTKNVLGTIVNAITINLPKT